MVPWPAGPHKSAAAGRGEAASRWRVAGVAKPRGDPKARCSPLDGSPPLAHTVRVGCRLARARLAACGLGLAACEVAAAPEDLADAGATAAAVEPCASAEAVEFTWALEPVPEDMSTTSACTLGEPAAIAGGLALPLDCAEVGARMLYVWATPALPTAALRPGLAVRLWALSSATAAGGEQGFVRLETAAGGLLLAAAAGGSLAPPDGARVWLPFELAPASSACRSEATACGASRRTAVELRRSGGAPDVALDASWAAVGDRGEAQLWVAAARRGDAGCFGEAGGFYSVGLVAAR